MSFFGGNTLETRTPAKPTVPPVFGGFETTTSNAVGFSGFGAPPAITSLVPAFTGFGTGKGATGIGSFGATTKFGENTFGKPAYGGTVTPAFGGFSDNTNFVMGQASQQQQIAQIAPDEVLERSVFNVSIYGDERDTILAKWNYFQAMWGAGKSFYSQNAAPVEITPENYLCRFKTVGYGSLPGKENKMGLVSLTINKPLNDVKAQQQQIVTTITAILGNKQNILLRVESLQELNEIKCQFVMFVEEKSQLIPNETKRILATELAQFLNQPNMRNQLSNLAISDVVALVVPDEDQIKAYLENPPKGIDARMWRQAIIDNPDSKKLIPMPIVGFSELKWRIKCQENETEMHALFLRQLDQGMSELRQRDVVLNSKLIEQKRQFTELNHRVLKVIVRQEAERKAGISLTAEEEALRAKVQNMYIVISTPKQFKGRLSELLSVMRMQRKQYLQMADNEYTLNKDCAEEMKSFLTMQHEAMKVLTDTVTTDMKALKIISEGMPELVRS